MTTATIDPTTTLGTANFADLMQVLRATHDARRDLIVSPYDTTVPPTVITDPAVRPDHVLRIRSRMEGLDLEDSTDWKLTDHASMQLAERLGIHAKYWRKMRDGHGGLLSHNANYWFRMGDPTPYMVRGLEWVDDDGEVRHIARAIMSNQYSVMDNFEVALGVTRALREAGLDGGDVQIGGSLSETKFHLRVTAPQITASAHDLVEKYQFNGRKGQDYPLVAAGLVISNSEVGNGALYLAPRLTWQVCTNGMTRSEDIVRTIHRGVRQSEGIIQYTEDTQRKQLIALEAEVKDAVKTFLSVDYVERVLDELRGAAQLPLNHPAQAVTEVTQKLKYSEAEVTQVLDAFIRGGDDSALGVGQAITATAQAVRTTDPDRAAELEMDFFSAVRMATAHAQL